MDLISITKAWLAMRKFPSQKCAHLGFKCSTSHDSKARQKRGYCHLKDPDSSQRLYWSIRPQVINWDCCYWTSSAFWTDQCHNWIGSRISQTYIEGLQPASPWIWGQKELGTSWLLWSHSCTLIERVNHTSRLGCINVNSFCLWIPENLPGFQKALEIKQQQKSLECLWSNKSSQECDYFPSLIVSLGANSHLELLFKVTQSLLGREGPEEYLQDNYKDAWGR